MTYSAWNDTYTEITETTGTIQNNDTIFDLELKILDLSTSETAIIALNPRDSITFANQKIFIRCREPEKKILARVVPFIATKCCQPNFKLLG